jgi:predicted ATPase
VEGLAARLDDRFRLLTGGYRTALPRHQTLRATLDWSYKLLPESERLTLRRMAVFAGAFTLESASAVAVDTAVTQSDVVERLANLVAKSLVTADVSRATVPYRLLETTRAYALEKLRDAGEADATRERHAQAILAIFEAGLQQQWVQPRDVLVEAHLPDLDNLRAALEWATVSTAELHIALAGASVWMWAGTGQRVQALRICERAMERIDQSTPPALEARLISEWCVLPSSPPVPAERAAAERAVALFRNPAFRVLRISRWNDSRSTRIAAATWRCANECRSRCLNSTTQAGHQLLDGIY